MQQGKAYTAASIITHTQSKAVKQAQICTSRLLSYNYNNEVPSNIDPRTCYAYAQNLRDSSTETTTGSYELNQRYPTLLTQQKALNKAQGRILTLTHELPEQQKQSHAYANRLQKGDVSRTSPSLIQASKSGTKRSVSARGVQRYHSHFSRSLLPSAIVEDKVR
ncbi:hypothetical protein F511_23365 [Dorcoceras hygrometricum]|uniref:Uncharacterized protein n=1 Tax=Dorcoceras hygrometricum TaxID=472368 RepID=A0A2Z7BRU8_9LAMI|nr:hypothetical protein F511_23365 [Dorcoceras hygrometricum]